MALTELPLELQVTVLANCDVATVGRAGSTCWSLSRNSESVWHMHCHRQGLRANGSGSADASARGVLRRAALCRHRSDGRPASRFEWQCEAGSVRCRCMECGRAFDATLTMGCVDTASFSCAASRLV